MTFGEPRIEPNSESQRSVVVLDDDGFATDRLRSAWSKLGIADELKIVELPGKALSLLRDSVGSRESSSVLAIVLDPTTLGNEAYSFLRQIREIVSAVHVPILLWSQDSPHYDKLEGHGVDCVLRKPTVAHVIRALDSECALRMRELEWNGLGVL